MTQERVMAYVTAEQATVFRPAGNNRRYLSKQAAYRDLAKRIIVSAFTPGGCYCYPGGDYGPTVVCEYHAWFAEDCDEAFEVIDELARNLRRADSEARQ